MQKVEKMLLATYVSDEAHLSFLPPRLVAVVSLESCLVGGNWRVTRKRKRKMGEEGMGDIL